ncbi:MAG: molybdate ABC transporter ATP-binding protein ModF [Treponemataceae bacterium]|nr:MAG: molybdate ABC transporter ATP-binding protein ModF [Treponemataceae bacterium]
MDENTFSLSIEDAAKLIEEERKNDDSDFTPGGIDIGRTVRVFLREYALSEKPEKLEDVPEVALLHLERVLDTGLKYLSTGEIRKTLLCRVLLQARRAAATGNRPTLLLHDALDGLDASSQNALTSFFAGEAQKANGYKIIMDNARTQHDRAENSACRMQIAKEVQHQVDEAVFDRSEYAAEESESAELVKMCNVNVGWGERRVLRNFSWSVNKGEHWFIQGPNGSGKTTLLELITGDNMQAFSNEVYLFGKKRGSGETLWDIRRKLGIVSYRLHTEYRMVADTPLVEVLVSGFHDSIGLYEQKTDGELAAAHKWLLLEKRFAGREDDAFSSFSYGEQRAALILRAAVKCPPLIILDEPCHALDAEEYALALAVIESVANTGFSTLLHVSHNPSERLPCEKNILRLEL